MKSTLRCATWFLMAATCLIPAVSQKALAQAGKCSEATVHGDYGYTAEGVLIIPMPPGPPVQVPLRSTGMAHFDGKGTLTWVEHTVVNGAELNAGWLEAKGSYMVNPNCTAQATVITANSADPLNFFAVVVKEGKEVRTILNAHAIVSVFSRVD